ncbi:uncharacterized protein LOC110812561 isoform X1 [Carica papaya]|uniref:uncharacterized protein LOC110812561 isoform X1 n=1 Tax=Carica papaya TaxID=3649 RepID=UPI000B8CB2EB|nr:uncharacterized protein LOC110812561 isoform X1 [Carica papaya]
MAGVIESEKYCLLKDFSVDVEVEDEGSFSLCFWVYLLNSTTFPATIIRQVHMDMSVSAPFLVLNENKMMMLLPLTLLHREAPDPGNTASWTEVPNVPMKIEFPLEKWIHVGCEVSRNFVRLHIDGDIVGEQFLSSLLNKDSNPDFPRKMTLFSVGGDGYSVQGYIYNAKVVRSRIYLKEHYVEDPPLHLSIDNSSTSEIEVDSDGVWSIVGGKASCRRIFSLDLILSNAIGQTVTKEMEVVASLLYADSGTPVEKTGDAEPPLLASYDGIEFASGDRPSKLLRGRASFKLKISQLSSKCDNRLFCIKFQILKLKGYPFFEVLSNPIRCISRSRNTRTATVIWKRTTSASHLLNETQSSGLDDNSSELRHHTIGEATPTPSLKRCRLGEERISIVERPEEECNSYGCTAKQNGNAYDSRLEERPNNLEEAENSSSDSESTEVRDPAFRSMSSSRNPISDLAIFKYCLGRLTDRSLLLKEIVTNASDTELFDFADQVSLFSGCSHHSYQIHMAKRLIAEGEKAWNSISENNHQVHWENVVFEIEEQFMKISCCNTRSLTQQDLELLRRIAGCHDYVVQENFERMWCWLYPVAYTLSRDWINAMWNSASPKWIEGFVTKEEAENSLQGPRGLQEPGTFILRFPTSRSWPHPDAGSLVVTYVGRDFALHHRLLSLDCLFSSDREMYGKQLQDMLLAEPELSQLGRVLRSY